METDRHGYKFAMPKKEKRNISVDKVKEINKVTNEAINKLDIITKTKIESLKPVIKWLQNSLKKGIIDLVEQKKLLPVVPMIARDINESKKPKKIKQPVVRYKGVLITLPIDDIEKLSTIRNEVIKIGELLDRIADLTNTSGSLSKNIQVIKEKFNRIFQHVFEKDEINEIKELIKKKRLKQRKIKPQKSGFRGNLL